MPEEPDPKIMFRACFNCTVEPSTFQHTNCLEIWWEVEGEPTINSDGRGQCWMCDCEKC